MTAAALAQAASTSAARLGSASGVKAGAPSTPQQGNISYVLVFLTMYMRRC
jgi:hypothetical protein